MATKEQELKALEQIRKIVEGLGEDSYLGITFEGCFDKAKTNIENDWACSYKQEVESLEERIEKQAKDIELLMHQKEHISKDVEAQMGLAEKFYNDAQEHAEECRDWKQKCEEQKQKVADLTSVIADKDSLLANRDYEIMKLKARLFDLLNA